MKIWAQAAVVVALAMAIPPVSSAQAVNPRAERLFDEIVETGGKGDLATALVKVDQALKIFVDPGLERGAFLQLRAATLQGLRRGAEALADAEQAVAMVPDDTRARLLLAELQLEQGRAIDASRTIVHLSDRQPTAIKSLNARWVGALLRDLDAGSAAEARFELALALTSRGFADPEWPGASDWINAEAIEGLIRRGRLDEAQPLVGGITDVTTQIKMLADRGFEPLWPELEAKAGPRAERLLANDLASARRAYERDPNNVIALRSYVMTLRSLGRSREAIGLAMPLAGDLREVEKRGPPAFWLVNEVALALAESGQVDAGDRLFDRLLTLGVAEHPELVSMAINRGAMLLNANRPTDALAAAAFVDAQGAGALSDYGRMWNWQIQTCALRALGRSAEAQPIFDRMVATKSANDEAYMLALLCHDRLGDAEQLIVDRLADGARRADMLLALQDFRSSSQPTLLMTMREKLLSLRTRPAVRRAIDASGRIRVIDADRTYWGSF